jgi:hypothetical protein
VPCKKKWKYETHGLCCADGRVILYQFEDSPDLIKSLIDYFHPLSKYFFDNSRRYNTLFQITSFGANEMAEGNFIPTFKIQVQVHHLIGSLLPKIGINAKCLQIYFMSESDQIKSILQIKSLQNNIIEAVILTGPEKRKITFIPRIPMIPFELLFSFKRLQFAVGVSFAITINKTQGQTFRYVDSGLRTECFSHGQLYVRFS